ncbi:MAG TPA: glycosyltransferase family 4 protein [Polyangium sp.]|nr:glycosyltransferase family 4 protein [Polyangium sp.]
MSPDTSTRAHIANMRIAHVLRKYDPREWAGTETALRHLLCALRTDNIDSVVYAPKLDTPIEQYQDLLRNDGVEVRRFRTLLPLLGVSSSDKKTLLAIGGNIVSFDAPFHLFRESPLDLIHTHALNRLGSIARLVARCRRIPFVVTIHGGYLDLPSAVAERLTAPSRGALDYGKLFSLVLQSRRLITDADVVITVNPREAELLRAKYPSLRVEYIPHGVPCARYMRDHRDSAEQFLPAIRGKTVVLLVGRIDSVKNQGFLVECWPEVRRRLPDAVLVLVGPATDLEYQRQVQTRIRALGLESSVFLVGQLSADDLRLIGLFQTARVFVLPSSSEPFGLVLLEAWAAGCPVIASATSGAKLLVRDAENGFLFEPGNTHSFLQAFERTFENDERRKALGYAGQCMVQAHFDSTAMARRVLNLYSELCGTRRGTKSGTHKGNEAE